MSMKWLSYLVISYMLLALIWWTILLHSKNQQAFDSKAALMTIQGNLTEIAPLESEYKRQANMILGEGIVFGVSLLLGIWLIQRSFSRELEVRERQNNFLLSVTHELKSPLTSINLSLETMRKRTLSQEMIKDISDTALGESHRLENLINDLLLATKLDHEYAFLKTNTDVSTMIKEILDEYFLNRDNVVLHHHIQDAIFADIDQAAFEKVVTNLIENSIKYGNGQKIEVNLLKEQDNKSFKLEVKDEGPGIPIKEREKIFQKFYRVGSENTRKTKGTGLGLYIIERIVEGHHGTVSYLENKPTGAIFEVKIPMKA